MATIRVQVHKPSSGAREGPVGAGPYHAEHGTIAGFAYDQGGRPKVLVALDNHFLLPFAPDGLRVEERQEQPQTVQLNVYDEVCVAPEIGWDDRLTIVKAARRREGRCMLCGAARGKAGKGCYQVAQGYDYSTWAAHDWPEGEWKRG